MKLITAIIQENRLDEVREALMEAEIERITVNRVAGHGRQETREIYRGQIVIEYYDQASLESLITRLAPRRTL